MRGIYLILLLGLTFFLLLNFFVNGLHVDNSNGNLSNRQISDQVTKKKSEEQDLVTLLLGGDVMLGRSVMQAVSKNNNNYPFEKIIEFTQDSDIFFVNLENPIVQNCPPHLGGFKFCSNPEILEGVTRAGINIVSLANNHSRNYGEDGFTQTTNFLTKYGINYVGNHNLVIYDSEVGSFLKSSESQKGDPKTKEGLVVGFLGFDFTVRPPGKEDLLLVDNSDPLVDILVVGVHWGDEYKAVAGVNQRKWAREMVLEGADVIVGHHPHWIEDLECLGISETVNTQELPCDGITGKPVYYSLGNLVFDQMWSEETKKGMLIKLKIGKKGIVSEEKINTYIRYVGQPEIVTEESLKD